MSWACIRSGPLSWKGTTFLQTATSQNSLLSSSFCSSVLVFAPKPFQSVPTVSCSHWVCVWYIYRLRPICLSVKRTHSALQQGLYYWSTTERFKTEEGRAGARQRGPTTAGDVISLLHTVTLSWLCVDNNRVGVILVLHLIFIPFMNVFSFIIKRCSDLLWYPSVNL